MAVQIFGMWRLDHGALEIGDRVALYDECDKLQCELRCAEVHIREDLVRNDLVVDGPEWLLESLYKRLPRIDRDRVPHPVFVFYGTVEQGAELAFNPSWSYGSKFSYVSQVARISVMRLETDELTVDDYQPPVIEQV